jgi:hypothetical protein
MVVASSPLQTPVGTIEQRRLHLSEESGPALLTLEYEWSYGSGSERSLALVESDRVIRVLLDSVDYRGVIVSHDL